MKPHLLYFFLILSQFIINSKVHAQCCPSIGSISISPNNPTLNDSIQITTQVTTTSYGSKISQHNYIYKDTLFLEGCYINSVLTSPRMYSDTFQFGKLNSGSYTIHFKAILSSKKVTCVVGEYQIKVIPLFVNKAGINSLKEKPVYELFPNPFNNTISIKGKEIHRVIVSNTNGQIVKNEEINGVNNATIDLGFLVKGFYFIEIISKDGKVYREKIVKE